MDAFFTGRMGVPYVLLKMAAEFGEGEDNWTAKALEIAKPCASFLNNPHGIDDLIVKGYQKCGFMVAERIKEAP